ADQRQHWLGHVGINKHQGGIGQHRRRPRRQQARVAGTPTHEHDAAGPRLTPSRRHRRSYLPTLLARLGYRALDMTSRAPKSNSSAATESPSSRARSGLPIPDARITSDPSSAATQLRSDNSSKMWPSSSMDSTTSAI